MVTVIATGFDEAGIRERVKRPANLREFMKIAEKPAKRRQEAFDFKNEALGIDCDDLDKPTFLRRQADYKFEQMNLEVNHHAILSMPS
jgi:hypothetical protein